MDTIKLELSKQLAASCCCLTKTNEPKYHDELCYYRLLMEKAAVDKPEVVLSNSTNLLCCPHCGGVAKKQKQYLLGELHTWAQCMNTECGASANIEAWQKRAT